ncbi:MAG TPA: histidine kinase [Bacteroidales bacterium]|nr:histidine kinase [Bacteroidales bacterium]
MTGILQDKMEAKSFRQYFLIVVLLSIAIAITIRFPLIMELLFEDGDRDGSGGHHHREFSPDFARFFVDTAISFIVALVMFIINYFILKPTDRNRHITAIRIVLAVSLTILLVSILNHGLYSVSSIFDTRPPGRGRRNEFEFMNFYVSALVVGCVLVIRLVFQKQGIKLEYEELKREALRRQYESLKNQLSPHFLFNSLTALKVLIQDDSDKAQSYVNSLSKALRYTLQSNEKQLVTLNEEMEFMHSYIYLIRMRYDTNLIVNYEINESFLLFMLPPLTIQTLVENAIKHNEISKRKPLKIDIVTTVNESLLVRNNIQKKYTEESGTGLGLTNLSKQFEILVGKDIIITKNDESFTVEIPLIKQ